MEKLILVNEADEQTGTMEKMQVHRLGLLHRAFSVIIFNHKGQMLLQQRALDKYHSGGLWTNACCSHPQVGQQIQEAAEKRLKEEMGFTVALTPAFSFIYKAAFDNGLTEYEFDHVFIGHYEGSVSAAPEEVESYRYMDMSAIKAELEAFPQKYTEWFKIVFPKIETFLSPAI